MAIDDRCLQTLKAAGLSQEDAEDKLGDVQRRMEGYRQNGENDSDAIKKAIADSLNADSVIAQRGRVNALMNLNKRMDMWNGVQNSISDLGKKFTFADRAYQAIRAKLVGINSNIPFARVSMDADMQATKAKMLGGFLKELADSKLSKLAFKGTYDEDIAREMAETNKGKLGKPGITKNPIAKQIADIYSKYGELGKQAVNKEGAFVGDLTDYIARNEHNWESIKAAGYDVWKADALKFLDHDMTFAGMDKIRQEEFLNHSYNALVSGEFFAGGPIGMEARGAPIGDLATRMSRERVFRFTDDGWYKYWQKYGTSGSLAESIQNTLSKSARDSVLMRYFGTNPNQEFTNLLTRLRQEYSSADPVAIREFTDKYQPKLQNRYNELSGAGDKPTNQLAQSIGVAVRTFENIVHLGKVPFAHTSIAVTRALNAHHWGDSVFGALTDSLKATLTGGHAATAEGREMLDMIGARNDGFIAHIMGGYNEGFTGMAATLSNLEMKASGLTYIMNANRRSDEWMLSKFLGGNLDKEFGGLSPRTQGSLSTYGIQKSEWEALRKVEPTDFQGKKFLTPDMAGDNEMLAQKLASMFSDSSRRAMNIPGSEVKALLFRDMPFGGPLGRAVAQFKQWPTELMLNAFGRAIYDNPTTGQKMLSLFGILIPGLTAAGLIRMSLRNISMGQEPPNPAEGKTVIQAAIEGGAGVMIGDTIAALVRQHEYPKAVASLFGPAGEDAFDIGKIAWNAGHGKNQMRQIEEFGLKHIPFQNLWETDLLTNYLFLWGLHEQVHPGWSQRYENYIEQDTGNRPFLGPTQRIQ